jgi:hypothetical protein
VGHRAFDLPLTMEPQEGVGYQEGEEHLAGATLAVGGKGKESQGWRTALELSWGLVPHQHQGFTSGSLGNQKKGATYRNGTKSSKGLPIELGYHALLLWYPVGVLVTSVCACVYVCVCAC